METKIISKKQNNPVSYGLTNQYQLYINEIWNLPKLTTEEEVALGKIIKDNITFAKEYEKAKDLLDKHNLNSDMPELTTKGKTDLEKILKEYEPYAKKYKQAKDLLYQHNLKIVVWLAKKAFAKVGLNIMSMIQEGNIELLKRIDAYDYTKNVRLTSYAYDSIKKAVFKCAFSQLNTIYRPDDVSIANKRVQQFVSSFIEKHNREPDPKKVADFIKSLPTKPTEVPTSISIETPVTGFLGFSDDLTIGDSLADDPTQLDKVCNDEIAPIIIEAINKYLGNTIPLKIDTKHEMKFAQFLEKYSTRCSYSRETEELNLSRGITKGIRNELFKIFSDKESREAINIKVNRGYLHENAPQYLLINFP